MRLTEPVWQRASLSEVQSRIAEVILGELPTASTIGDVTLYDHQADAVQRLSNAIERFNGALLCDEVGMGKTYVAVAIARRFSRPLVVTPAALLSMWQSALETTAANADVVTFETLSRMDVEAWRGTARPPATYDFVVIDEAHHARNPCTNRYFALENLVRGAKVLLMSATPIHNRRHDLIALLSLFLGSCARSMTSSELAQCVVRREQRQIEWSVRLPLIRPATRHDVGDDSGIVEALMNLPPPVSARDGGVAGALIGRGLVHQWASSEAALRAAIQRRIAKATALFVSLEAGTYPTVAELESWIYDDGALQLGFAELLSAPIASRAELLDGVRKHLTALQSVKTRFTSSNIDRRRAEVVSAIRVARSHARIVAFAQYGETVAMLYRRLARTGYVAMLTSHGARVAGGSLRRNEAIARFAPIATLSKKPAAAEAIHLLLTTDLLSEGVNLQDADTVIHLDTPWTAARMEQRVGRVARLGSLHEQIHVHLLRTPPSAAQILDSELIVDRKRKLASSEESLPRKVERLRAILGSWRRAWRPSARRDNSHLVTATAFADADGFIAAVSVHGTPSLVVYFQNEIHSDLDAQLCACSSVQEPDGPADPNELAAAFSAIGRWNDGQRAASAAGISGSHALRRRELIARIDSMIESAAPHRRSAILALAERARAVVTRSHGAAIERELETLVREKLTDEKWLAAIADMGTQQAITRKSDDESLKIHAVLFLRIRPHRSPSPHDPGSP